ncbi:unnamed protein product [Heligmosomoides polygyrus]|uniref:DUF5641 domain-containing protein n=1 Tax=Heligmosomoides polygyrus TaxID=6339 RepID=A0A3P8ITM7_HELPZ|nr:unnamed protein product [Heligmosomoides polygyrus]
MLKLFCMFFVTSLQPMDSQPGSYATTPKFSKPLIRSNHIFQSHLFRSTTPQANITDYCANRKISFNSIASHSPWQGGAYERMVSIFKAAYRNAIGREIFDIETLKTIAAECTAICNSRNLVELWKTTNETLSSFWDRWNSEYLTSLREQYKRSHKHPRLENNSQPQLHEYVLIRDNTLQRGHWKRTVQLRLANKEIITRPINLISPLELSPQKNNHIHERDQKAEQRSMSTHPMKRGQERIAYLACSLLTIALIVATLISSTSATRNSRCPTTVSIAGKIIYAEQCRQNGIAVASFRETTYQKQRLCCFPISCPTRPINIPIPAIPNTGYCGKKCFCSNWA